MKAGLIISISIMALVASWSSLANNGSLNKHCYDIEIKVPPGVRDTKGTIFELITPRFTELCKRPGGSSVRPKLTLSWEFDGDTKKETLEDGHCIPQTETKRMAYAAVKPSQDVGKFAVAKIHYCIEGK